MKSSTYLSITILCSLLFLSGMALAYSSTNTNTSSISPKIILGPFPQHQEQNSIVIIWQTNNITSDNYIRWGLTPDCPHTTHTINPLLTKKTAIHMIKINELSPSTKYFYKAVSDSFESGIYTFSTIHEISEPITFVVYGDTRGVWDNWTNASIVATAIENAQPHFVLHTGDIINDGLIEEEWLSFFTNSSFIHNSTLYPTLGNHENYGELYYKYFNLGGNERWFSFNNGPVHFIGLDSNYLAPFRFIQNIWLINDLRTNQQPFTIVFFHHPMYSSGNHGSTTHLQWFWQPLFEFFEVDIVFNGHDHDYERGLVNNVSYIIAGGGGAPLYDVGSNWWTVHAEKCFHYCLVSANLTSLSIQTIKPDGTVIDSYSIQK